MSPDSADVLAALAKLSAKVDALAETLDRLVNPRKAGPPNQAAVNNPGFVPMLDDRGVAKYLQVSVATVRKWRIVQEGPRYYKLGSSVRYYEKDLEEFVLSRKSEAGNANGFHVK